MNDEGDHHPKHPQQEPGFLSDKHCDTAPETRRILDEKYLILKTIGEGRYAK